MKTRFVTPVLLIDVLVCFSAPAMGEHSVRVKYRATPVDVEGPGFESIGNKESSLVQGAWYDEKNQYMVIDLNGTNYHYCGLDKGTWRAFKSASSLGRFYHAEIKGNFDCRENPVAEYGR